MSNENNTPQAGGYGYEEHVQKESSFVFGLNAGNVRLTKFAWTANGGKDGAEMEALDIMFTVDGNDKGYRKFPIAKAFVKDEATGGQLEVTDPAHPAMAEARQQLSAVLVHIIGCFVEKDAIKSALNRQIGSFKEYCEILQSLLPANHATIALDAFGQYQWQISGENKVTYLEFPKNMKHGRWLNVAVVPAEGWEKQQKVQYSNSDTALRWVDADGKPHPFFRNGWYMDSNFVTQQKEVQSQAGQAMQQGSAASTSGDW